MALGLDWIAEFMDTYPVPVRFEHFAELRAFLVAQAAAPSRAEFERPAAPTVRAAGNKGFFFPLRECILRCENTFRFCGR